MHPPDYWHRHAKETRELAAMVSLPSDKLSLLKMAEDYDRQAKAAEERSREHEAPDVQLTPSGHVPHAPRHITGRPVL